MLKHASRADEAKHFIGFYLNNSFGVMQLICIDKDGR